MVALFRARTRNENGVIGMGGRTRARVVIFPWFEIDSSCVDGWPSRSDFRFRISRWRLPQPDTNSPPPQDRLLLCYFWYPFLSLFLLKENRYPRRPKGVTSVRGSSQRATRKGKTCNGRGYPRSGKFEFESRSRSVACGHGSWNLHTAKHVKGDDEVERSLCMNGDMLRCAESRGLRSPMQGALSPVHDGYSDRGRM